MNVNRGDEAKRKAQTEIVLRDKLVLDDNLWRHSAFSLLSYLKAASSTLRCWAVVRFLSFNLGLNEKNGRMLAVVEGHGWWGLWIPICEDGDRNGVEGSVLFYVKSDVIWPLVTECCLHAISRILVLNKFAAIISQCFTENRKPQSHGR